MPSRCDSLSLIITLRPPPSSVSLSCQTPLIVRTLCLLGAVDRNEPKYVAAVHTLLEQRAKVTISGPYLGPYLALI